MTVSGLVAIVAVFTFWFCISFGVAFIIAHRKRRRAEVIHIPRRTRGYRPIEDEDGEGF